MFNSTIIVHTQAHNSKATICRAIDSVLNQTYKNFVYYIADNGSSDGTREIIESYAAKDSRIVPVYFPVNDGATIYAFDNIIATYQRILLENRGEFYCSLDSDDEYMPNFLEETLRVAQNGNYDIVICGNQVIDLSIMLVNDRKIPKDIELTREIYDRKFDQLYCFFRTIWGKLFRISTVGEKLYSKSSIMPYGGDTMMVLDALCVSKRAIVISSVLHKYYYSPKSVSYKYEPLRLKADSILFDKAFSFIKNKVGYVSDYNKKTLYIIYYYAIRDTLSVVLKSNITNDDKISNIFDVLSCTTTLTMLGGLENPMIDIVKCLELVGEVYNALVAIASTTINREALWLGMNLSAMLQKNNDYIYWNKKNIEYLINEQQFEEAQEQLDEWLSMLPEDIDLDNLKKYINKMQEKI